MLGVSAEAMLTTPIKAAASAARRGSEPERVCLEMLTEVHLDLEPAAHLAWTGHAPPNRHCSTSTVSAAICYAMRPGRSSARCAFPAAAPASSGELVQSLLPAHALFHELVLALPQL